MARKKITLAFINNKTERRASFRKRRKGLLKKVKEISTLCAVNACAMVFSPFDQSVEVWPSLEEAAGMLDHCHATSEIYHRPHKELDIDSFTQQRMNKTRQKLDRLSHQNKRIDLYRCMAGMNRLDNLGVGYWVDMERTIDQEIRDVRAQIEKLTMKGGRGDDAMAPPTLPPPVAPMAQPTLTLTPPMNLMDLSPPTPLSRTDMPPIPPMARTDLPPLTPLIEMDFSMLDWDLEELLYPY